MKFPNRLIFPAAVFALTTACTSTSNSNPHLTDFVDPFIGTGGHGHVFVGANVPFGMVQLGPSQHVKGWDWCSGYHYSDSILLGFSHTHLSGTGIGDLGDILFFPTANPALEESKFSHDRESARPGYYSVSLDDAGVQVELTATTHAGLHRYTFNPEDTAYVKINLMYGIGWDRMTSCGMEELAPDAVAGYRYSTGWAKDQKIYFHAEFSRPMVRCELSDTLATCVFAPSDQPLLARVGISANGMAQAKDNLYAELDDFDFDGTRTKADNEWNTNLARINVEGDSERDKRVFYTSLFHAMTAPVTFSDANAEEKRYSVFSLWDTYRAAHPMYSIVFPEMQSDIAATFMDIYNTQGKLPVWHLHGNETDCMIGNPGVIVLGDLVLKGYVEDKEAALEAMKASAMLDERSLGALKTYGYIPFDEKDCNESVAKGMEYAIADDAIAKVSAAIGSPDSIFTERAKAYRLYFDSQTGFMRGRDKKGQFRDEEFNPFAASHRANDYCEGNAWQYIWLAPHDPHGLIGLFGSDDAFASKLDSLFIVEGNLGDNASPDISGLIGQYAHGNEPSHHVTYMYAYAGMPYKSAPLVRRILTELYHDAPDGLCGNEDVGQMSSWFVLSSMGLYQVEPAGGKYIIGSPLFKSATIKLPENREFTITAENNSDKNIYVQSATLNGLPYSKSYITFDDIMAGGELVLTMGDTPSDFGTKPEDRP